MSATQSAVLFGRERHRSRQFIGFAAAMFVLTAVFFGGMMTGTLPFIWPLVYLPVLIGIIAALVNAYLNSGLVVSALNTVVIAGAMVLTHGLRAVLSPSWPMIGWSWYLWVGAVLLGVGISAFVLGAGMRRLVGHFG
ncbi:hypothetical protein [Halococcus salsus]|uniref:hypothetical protein n=1 Tax=Halococcus salsus TaxID=2162894 RepID=UPI00135C9B08|nr:hypothetical protein [Halococcus salsus]